MRRKCCRSGALAAIPNRLTSQPRTWSESHSHRYGLSEDQAWGLSGQSTRSRQGHFKAYNKKSGPKPAFPLLQFIVQPSTTAAPGAFSATDFMPLRQPLSDLYIWLLPTVCAPSQFHWHRICSSCSAHFEGWSDRLKPSTRRNVDRPCFLKPRIYLPFSYTSLLLISASPASMQNGTLFKCPLILCLVRAPIKQQAVKFGETVTPLTQINAMNEEENLQP